jgi:hypothetical protein
VLLGKQGKVKTSKNALTHATTKDLQGKVRQGKVKTSKNALTHATTKDLQGKVEL